jgi:hypothetical protein
MRFPRRAPLLVASLVVTPLAASMFLPESPSARASTESTRRARPQLTVGPRLRPEPVSPGVSTDRSKFLRAILPKLGSRVAFRKVARSLDVTEFRGRRIDPPSRRSETPRVAALDQPVDSFDGSQNEPSIAVDPTNESTVVVFAHNEANFSGFDNACSIYVSFDGGVTFTYLEDAPLPNVDDTCADPVVRYAPDGSVVYFNYLAIHADDTSDILVTVGDGDDPTFFVSGPTSVLPGGADFVDKNWLGVHTFDSADGVEDGAGHVYVTATLFIGGEAAPTGCDLLINRSSDYGVTWDFGGGASVTGVASDCDTFFLHGSRVEGGPGEQVLVCFYNSEADGYTPDLLPPALSNRFDITCVSSGDRWDTNSAPITAANNVSFELDLFLGPGVTEPNYHRWFGAMFPAIAIDHRGYAHVVFTMDPTANKLDAEAGNVQYVRSTVSAGNPPYTTWGGRVNIGPTPNPKAQGYPNVVAQRSNLTTNSYVYIAYYDHYRSPAATPNLLYDVRYHRSTNSGGAFPKAGIRVTDVPSMSDFEFIGDYFDAAATMRRYHLVWTDRADKTSINDLEDDIFADRY